MSEENVMDAVNAALGDAVAPEGTENETPPESNAEVGADTDDGTSDTASGGEPKAPESDEGDDKGGEQKPEGEEKPEEAPEEKGPNGERERNPDGTWKKAEPPKKDPVNDPIPENLKKDTSERIRSLIDIAKTKTEEAAKYKTDFDFLVQGVQATGTTPQQYGEMLSWMGLFNSKDPAQQEKALEQLEDMAERLATFLGKERTVGDPLKGHQDLIDAVRTGKLAPQFANEMARTRNGQNFRTQLTAQQSEESQRQQQAQQEETTARDALTNLGNTLQATDPQYEQKKNLLVPILKPIFATIPPSQWPAKFQEAYKALKIPAPAAARTPPKGVPPNQPLRAKQPAGGQVKAPGSMLEAISGALSGMNK